MSEAPPALDVRTTDADAGESVARLLVRAAVDRPTAAALVGHDGRVVFTVGELAERSARLAGSLARRGVAPGDRVVVLARQPRDALPVLLATIWAGGVAVVPPRAGGLRVALRAAAASRPRAVVADALTWPLAMLEPGLRRGLVTCAALARTPALALPVQARDPSAPALVSFTTGTTGEPRAVVRTHEVLQGQHEAFGVIRPVAPGEVDLVGVPMLALHDLLLGVGFVVLTAATGTDRSPAAGRQLRDLARRTGATMAAGFPSLFETLVAGAVPGELPRLRSLLVGGADVDAWLVERLAEVAPAADVVVVYGTTEAEPIATIGAAEYADLLRGRRLGCGLPVGRPVSGIEVRVEPISDASLAGRVLVRGRGVSLEASSRDGWLDTGDTAWVDDHQRLWLLGRRANVGPGPLFPAAVEEPARLLPGVTEAALVNVLSPAGVEEPVLALVVARRSGMGTAASQAHAAALRLVEEHGWPVARVALVGRLPRDARTGSKIDYRALRALLGRAR